MNGVVRLKASRIARDSDQIVRQEGSGCVSVINSCVESVPYVTSEKKSRPSRNILKMCGPTAQKFAHEFQNPEKQIKINML